MFPTLEKFFSISALWIPAKDLAGMTITSIRHAGVFLAGIQGFSIPI